MPFFENAIELDTYLISDYPQVKTLAECLFQELVEVDPRRVKTKTEEYRSNETLKIILINLIVANDMGVAVRYSRRTSSYTKNSRYGRIYFKHGRVTSIIDTLVGMGYVENWKGYYNRQDQIRRESRMAATEKLVRLFEEHDIFGLDYIGVSPPDRDDLIQLRDEKDNPIKFDDFGDKYKANKESMTDDLTRYNDFISQHEVSFILQPETPVHVYFLNSMLKRRVNKGIAKITDFQTDGFIKIEMDGDELHGFRMGDEEYLLINGPGSERTKHSLLKSHKYKISHYRNYYNKYINNKFYKYNISSTISNTNQQQQTPLPITGNYFEIYPEYQIVDIKGTTTIKEELIKRPLSYFGIHRLSFVSYYQYLHRVFNIYPDNAGRFYGACHINMPKDVRKCIVIDGEHACELDYKAHHIRMLYHWVDVDYRDDPYEKLCDGDPSQRPVYKIVLLVSINAKDEKKAIKGIRKELWDNGIPFDTTDKSLKACIDKFKDVHKPISGFLNSGRWGHLQYDDSRITNLILQRMIKEGVPCLPVHDSYIVPARHEDLLGEAMTEAYQKVMYGFSPVIEKEF